MYYIPNKLVGLKTNQLDGQFLCFIHYTEYEGRGYSYGAIFSWIIIGIRADTSIGSAKCFHF